MNNTTLLLTGIGIIALVELLGHFIVCSMWCMLITPFFIKFGGDFTIINISAICICVLSALTVVFIIGILLYFIFTKRFNNWHLIITGIVWLGTFICVCINFSRLFNPISVNESDILDPNSKIYKYYVQLQEYVGKDEEKNKS